MPLEFNGQRIDDPEGREARDMKALVGRAGDPKPATNTINSLDSFWRFFLEGVAANNAAWRALRWRS